MEEVGGRFFKFFINATPKTPPKNITAQPQASASGRRLGLRLVFFEKLQPNPNSDRTLKDIV